jgi:hypothetical protein
MKKSTRFIGLNSQVTYDDEGAIPFTVNDRCNKSITEIPFILLNEAMGFFIVRSIHAPNKLRTVLVRKTNDERYIPYSDIFATDELVKIDNHTDVIKVTSMRKIAAAKTKWYNGQTVVTEAAKIVIR